MRLLGAAEAHGSVLDFGHGGTAVEGAAGLEDDFAILETRKVGDGGVSRRGSPGGCRRRWMAESTTETTGRARSSVGPAVEEEEIPALWKFPSLSSWS